MDYRKLPRKKRSKIWSIPTEELRETIKNSLSLNIVLVKYNINPSSGSYLALKTRLKQENIDFSHIKLGSNANRGRKQKYKYVSSIEEILVINSSYSRTTLKKRLLDLGLLKNSCYECGIGPEWNDKKLSLQIDHINGQPNDNRLDNLRMLCPNCHSQTDTYAGKSKKK